MGRLFAANHSTAPERAFQIPGIDRGILFLSEPEFYRREAPVGQIAGAALSAHDEVNEKIRQNSARLLGSGMAQRAVVFNSVPVLLQGAEFTGSQARIGWKWLANGAAGRRIWNAYTQSYSGGRIAAAKAAEAYFSDSRAVDSVPVFTGTAEALPRVAAITARNASNYYHFLTETLPHIHLLLTSGFPIDQVNVHMNATTVSGFAQRLVADIFPDAAQKIRFLSGRHRYDSVLSVYTFDLWHPENDRRKTLAAGEPGIVDERCDGADGAAWPSRAGDPGHHGWGTYDQALLAFRQHAIALAARHAGTEMPRRIFLRRKPGQSRLRETRGEDELLEALHPQGFRAVYFEDHSPLAQVALMQNAAHLVGSHGAGFANMTFARDSTFVTEIGTLQTCKSRWTDFIPLAHLSGCRYASLFVDFNKDDPLVEPDFTVDSIVPPALSAEAIDAVTDYIALCDGGNPSSARPSSLSLAIGALTNGGRVTDATAIAKRLDIARLNDATLLKTIAGTCDAAGDLATVLQCLELLNAVQPPRKERLERLAWLTSRFGQTEKLKRYLAKYAEVFPDDCAAFVARAPRFRPFIETGEPADRPAASLP